MNKKIAVVAVHGVGQHAAGASANAVAGLLAGLNGYIHIPNPNGKPNSPSLPAPSPYPTFVERNLEIPLPGAELFRSLSEKKKLSQWDRFLTAFRKPLSIFEERRGIFEDAYTWSTWFSKKKQKERDNLQKSDIANEFMKVQLVGYEGDPANSTYCTCCLEGRRATTEGQQLDVHVYEMRWSDLSSANNSFLRFFMAFYQLILHLGSLGRVAVDQVALEHVGQWDWFLYQAAYTYANRVLGLFIFNLLAVLPVVAFAPLVLLLPPGAVQMWTAIAAIFVLVLAVALWLSQTSSVARHWWAVALALSVLSIGVSWVVVSKCIISSPMLLTIEWWIAASGVLLLWVFPNYDEVRNGTSQVSGVFVGASFVAFFFCLRQVHDFPNTIVQLRTASFLLIQYVLFALRLCWGTFIGLALVAFVMEGVCRLGMRRKGDPDKLARACAAARTARLTLSLSSVLLTLASILVWCGLYHYFAAGNKHSLFVGVKPELARGSLFMEPAKVDAVFHEIEDPPTCSTTTSSGATVDSKCLAEVNGVRCATDNARSSVLAMPGGALVDPNCLTQLAGVLCPPRPPGCELRSSATADPNRFFDALLLQSVHLGLPFLIGFSTVALLLFVLIILPSVYREIVPPLSAENRISELLGRWLSSGLGSLPTIVAIFWIAAIAVSPLYVLAAVVSFAWCHPGPWTDFPSYLYSFSGMGVTKQMLETGGALAAGSATVIVGLLLKSGSVVLDTVLDVDNYLRTSPEKSTPRARIVERYLALLHYLHGYRDSNHQGYDRIVIVAHSLGSVISADLFRFLRHGELDRQERVKRSEQLERLHTLPEYAFAGRAERIPMDFFTMGNPLRQLLNRFFPTMYRWVREHPDGTGAFPLFTPSNVDGVRAPLPRAAELGVEEWRNSYRSGDYVGRSLWYDDLYSRTLATTEKAGEYPQDREATTFPSGYSTWMESCIGLGAHTHYWDRTAPDIAAQLDQMIVGAQQRE